MHNQQPSTTSDTSYGDRNAMNPATKMKRNSEQHVYRLPIQTHPAAFSPPLLKNRDYSYRCTLPSSKKHQSTPCLLSLICTVAISFFPYTAFATPDTCSQSTIVLPFHIPMNVLSTKLNELAPNHLSGKEHNPVGFLTRDTITWSVTRGPIELGTRQGALRAKTKLAATATLRGKVPGFIGESGPYLQETLDRIRANVEASIKPVLTPTWRVKPQISANVHLTEASGKIAGFRYSLHSLLQGPLSSALNDEVRRLNSEVEKNQELRHEIAKFWNELHHVVALNSIPPIWLSIQPTSLGASAPEINDVGVTLTVGVSANTTLSVGAKPQINPSDLPDLLPISNVPTGRFRVALPVIVTWEDANREIAKHLIREPAVIEGSSGRLHLNEVTLSGTDQEELVVTATFSVEPTGIWGSFLAWIDDQLASLGVDWKVGNALKDQVVQLVATPRLDVGGTVLSLENPKLTEKSSEFLKSIAAVYAWLNDRSIEDLIANKAVADLSEAFADGNSRAQDEVDRISADLANAGVILTSTVNDVTRLDSLRVVPEALMSRLCAEAIVRVDVREFLAF